ncbi:MAG: ABC transporter permease [Gemmatimonadota bacterium]|nr:ABC transporter permease [Gemmatimonadota bacterium]
MSVTDEVSGARAVETGRRVLGALCPGVHQILAGRWAAGLILSGSWVGLLAVATTRWRTFPAVLTGGWDVRIAVAVIVFGPLAAWIWSWRDVRGSREHPEAGSAGEVVGRFVESPAAVAGLLTIIALVVVALITPVLASFHPAEQGDLLAGRFRPPSGTHLLGTDRHARDLLSRILYGGRVSLAVAFGAMGISVGVGTLWGAVAGYVGGRVDGVLMRIVDVFIAFPRLVLLIAVVAMYEPSFVLIVAVLGLTQWPGVARLVRGEVLSLREREFVLAARALGYSRRRILLRHVIPNLLAPLTVAAALGMGNTILLESGLGFLGLGLPAPVPTWGGMVADGRSVLFTAWWVAAFPGLAITVSVVSFNLVADGLRDALDPRLPW